MGCIWASHETQGITSDHHDSVFPYPLGHREWIVRGKLIVPLISVVDHQKRKLTF